MLTVCWSKRKRSVLTAMLCILTGNKQSQLWKKMYTVHFYGEQANNEMYIRMEFMS